MVRTDFTLALPLNTTGVQCLSVKTRRLIIVDTVQFFSHNLPFPEISLNDLLTMAIDNITSTLNSPKLHSENPTLQVDNQTKLGIQLVAGILHRLIQKQPTPLPMFPSDPKPHPTLPSQQLNVTKNVPTPNRDTTTLSRVPASHKTNPDPPQKMKPNTKLLPRVHRPIKMHPHTILRKCKNLPPTNLSKIN